MATDRVRVAGGSSLDPGGGSDAFAEQMHALSEGLARAVEFAELCRMHRSDLDRRATSLTADAHAMFRAALTERCAAPKRASGDQQGPGAR